MKNANDRLRHATVRVIAEILEIDPRHVRGRDRLREDLGMDSLGSLELLSTLSSQLKIDLEIEDAMGLETVDDACAFVARHAAGGDEHATAPGL